MIEKPAPAISPQEYHAALRGDFYTFMRRCFAELNSGASFLSNWHLQIVAAKLQEVRDGRIRRLIINIPPRSLKSLKTSIAFPAWLLGHSPSAAIISVTYGQELSDKFTRAVEPSCPLDGTKRSSRRGSSPLAPPCRSF